MVHEAESCDFDSVNDSTKFRRARARSFSGEHPPISERGLYLAKLAVLPELQYIFNKHPHIVIQFVAAFSSLDCVVIMARCGPIYQSCLRPTCISSCSLRQVKRC